jgi:hypothetical protein
MTTAFKICIEPDFCHFLLLFCTYHFSSQAENIQVVVASTHLSCNLIVARRGTNTRNLIRGNGHPYSGATEQNSSVNQAIGNLTGNIRQLRLDNPLLFRHGFHNPLQNDRDAPGIRSDDGGHQHLDGRFRSQFSFIQSRLQAMAPAHKHHFELHIRLN